MSSRAVTVSHRGNRRAVEEISTFSFIVAPAFHCVCDLKNTYSRERPYRVEFDFTNPFAKRWVGSAQDDKEMGDRALLGWVGGTRLPLGKS